MPALHVRVTPGVEAHTHEFIETGTEDSKFGFGLDNGDALAAVTRVVRNRALEFAGIHCHIGSQVYRADSFARAVDKMVDLVRQIEATTGATVGELNIGGGLGVRYLTADAPPTIEQYCTIVRDAFDKALAEAGVRSRPRLMTEPGRSIAAPAGLTLYRVGTIKIDPGCAHVRRGRRRHERQPATRHVRRALRGVPSRRGPPPRGRSRSRSRASTASRATCSSATRSSPTTWPSAISSRCR